MKRKITIDRPKVDAKEIAARQDFNSIINQLPVVSKPPFYKTGWFYTTLASIAGLAIVSTILLTSNPNNQIQELTMESPPTETNATAAPNNSESSNNLDFNYNEDTPCISPPSETQDIPMVSYVINGMDGGEIEALNGTLITIPKDAFVDSDGNIIKDDIELRYREIRNSIDMMLSGIPMHYDSAGLNQVLLSDGMIEIEGYIDGKEIFIAPNKNIKVALQSDNQDSKFNSYHLNEENDQWNYTGKPDIKVTQVEEHFTYNPISNLEDLKSEIAQLNKEQNIAKAQYEKAKVETNNFNKNAPEKPVSNGNKDRQFVLDVNPNEFPELAGYQSLLFEVEANDPNFSPSVYQENWTDISLSEGSKGKNYLMTLFKQGGKKTFSVFPVFKGKDYDVAMQKFNENFSEYQKGLNERKEKEANLKSEFEAKVAKWQEAKDKEAAAIIAQKNTNENTKMVAKIAKELKIDKFGIWNIDCGISPPKGLSKNIEFVSVNGTKVEVTNFNLFEKGKNTLYSFQYPNNSKIKYDPKEYNMIVAYLGDDRVGIARNNQFKNNNKTDITFTLDIQPLNEKLIKELKSETM